MSSPEDAYIAPTVGTLWVPKSTKNPKRHKTIKVGRTDDEHVYFEDSKGHPHIYTHSGFFNMFKMFEDGPAEEATPAHREGVKYAPNAQVYDARLMEPGPALTPAPAPFQPSPAVQGLVAGLVKSVLPKAPEAAEELPPNPKKIHGAGKPDLSLVPSVAIAHTAMAFEDGGYKYGPYNWRESAVEARTYIAAAKRHLNDYLDGTDCAEDSEVHNLGHVMACCAIILDAQANGNLIDNRPKPGASARVHDEMKELKATFKERGIKQWAPGSKM